MNAPTIMEATEARKVLEGALASKPGGPIPDLTIADATAKSGLPLRDAERGLHALVAEYRGHLRVTSEGELLFRFPTGFTKPWETRDRIAAAVAAIQKGALGVARFVVRAWIAVVLLGYVAIFVAVLVAQMFASQNSRDRGRGSSIGSGLAPVFFRVVFDALFWTFHPFSPFAYTYGPTWGTREPMRRAISNEPKEPFYERVNRFFFGPTAAPVDPRDMERKIVAEIRARKGRIGLADVMRVTGLPRDHADPLMARLMLDYDGDVEVSEAGGITYSFEALRKTAAAAGRPESAPPPVWSRVEKLPPLTGNDGGTNALIIGLNAFNLLMSLYAIDAGFTLSRLDAMLFGHIPLQLIPQDGVPIALGVVPLVFSIALFVLPILRALFRGRKARAVARENGRRAMLREILTKVGRAPITEEGIVKAWKGAAGSAPDGKEITREVVGLGGDVDLEGGAAIRYRFPDLEAEASALEAERAAASEEEARVGRVIYATDE